MRVGVGSDNPVKRDAVIEVLGNGDDEYGTHADIEAVPVESGVSDQPRGHTEPIRGAETRAENVLDVDAYEFAVGIEGGVGVFEGLRGCPSVCGPPSTTVPSSVGERPEHAPSRSNRTSRAGGRETWPGHG